MSYGIDIKEGTRRKCPGCGDVFAIENENEILYRNISLIHFQMSKGFAEAKCKKCKKMIKILFNNKTGKTIKVE